MKKVYCKPAIILIALFFFFPIITPAQGIIDQKIQIEAEYQAIRWKITCIDTKQRSQIEPFATEYKNLRETLRQLGDQLTKIKNSEEYKTAIENLYKPPTFSSRNECDLYRGNLEIKSKELVDASKAIKLKEGKNTDERYDPSKASMAKEQSILWQKGFLIGQQVAHCRCWDMDYSSQSSNSNSNIEAEFLAEIAKINSDIEKINGYARSRQLEISLVSAQVLCDKIRLLQGRQYFSSTLKEIRRKNPGFTFSITHLADQVTREYWIRMRNRANISYRKAMEAYSGCVYNEGIQQAGYVEIPMGFAKATYDLVTNWKDMIGNTLFGTFTALGKNALKGDYAVRQMNVVAEDIMKAGGDAYDWKSYAGVVGGFISAFDGYVKTYNIAVENYKQGDLLVMNRQSARQLIERNKLLLQEFDRYRAYIDGHSSSIDCLNDRLMRLNMDKNSIKGDKITIWGTGFFDWDGEEYIAMIVESGEDLKNEYIYCEDFVKQLQTAVNLANTEYYAIEDKVRNSGADQTQIDAQLSYNLENGQWFEQESLRLSEYYVQFCENERNTMPEDVVVVSTQVVPGVEVQNGDPNDPQPWEYETTNVNIDEDLPSDDAHYDYTGGGNSGTGTVSSGNGWSAQSTSATEESLSRDISNSVNSGKTPAGIYVGSNNEVIVYYIDDNPLGMTAWNLEWYTDAESLQSGVNSNLEQGYFPMGISFTDNGQLYVLYIMSQLKATAWQLVESELDLNTVSHNVNQYVHEHYVPVGITVFGGMYYTLLAKLPDSEQVRWTIEGYENTHSVNQGVNSMIYQGYVPFGYLEEQGIVNVLYIGF